MISAAEVSSFWVLRIRPSGLPRRIGGISLDQRHDGHAGLEPGETERQAGKDQERDRHHHDRAAMLGEERLPPVRREHSDLPATCCRLTATTTAFNAR